jgi:branched-chain amino acid transport system permease protein
MLKQDTLRYGLYIGLAAVVLALTGMFDSFAERFVIANWLSLNTVLLVVLLTGTGYYTAHRARQGGSTVAIVNGLVGSLIVGALLALLVLIESSIDMRFVFQNLVNPVASAMLFGRPLLPGLVMLLVVSVALGTLGGLLVIMPARARGVFVNAAGLTVVAGLLQAQVENVITLPDALALTLAFALGYAGALALRSQRVLIRLLVGLVLGAGVGLALAALVGGGALASGGLLRGSGSLPVVLSLSLGGPFLPLLIVFAVAGATGAAVTGAGRGIHDGALYFMVSLVILGVFNAQGAMNNTAALVTFVLLAAAAALVPLLSARAVTEAETLPRGERQGAQTVSGLVGLAVLLVAPLFLGQYITDVLNLVGLYIIMGIGLNVVVGYAGLLNLGNVAFFAIGAYAIGLLTTPSLLTCGGVAPAEITPENIATVCSGVMTFWQAWPIAILASALGGIALGIPVLRLRGDYLAIVTLGFGEIIRIIVKFDDFKPLFGAAQGIPNIPRPVIDLTAFNPAWRFQLEGATGIYYLILIGIVITALVANRLVGTRLGRAWRAMRADEDVAEAMGINLTRAKLLAFAIGAAFAGMGGAVAGTRLYGTYPDSFTLLVSVNVLSLIIIGGLGSIPGVVVGSLMLIGLPEILRELEDYRLLAFGVLLVVAMLLKPEGLLPPAVRRLSEVAETRRERQVQAQVKEGAA